ncbi:MAG TPA: beta-phosphoglucomutase [Chloroflexi bacterium]|nr:beta-phosphoglucomutase [Chloroflexota bacterium]
MQTKHFAFAVLWDMDGVLVDTGHAHFVTWRDTLAEIGKTYTQDDFRATFGMNNAGVLRYVFGEEPDPNFSREVGDKKEILFRQLIKAGVNPLPGVQDWLGWFRKQGLKQAIASSAPRENIDALVDGLKIRAYFDAIVSGADLPPKPNPHVFLHAAYQIGMPPERCLVIEDSVAGVGGARRAGMKCIAVTTTNSAGQLRQAHLVLTDLTELNEEHLAALF